MVEGKTTTKKKTQLISSCWWVEMQCYQCYDHYTVILKYTGKKTFNGYSPCSLFMADKHIWIGNDSKYCFMQCSSLDAVLHMQTDEIVIKRGEEKQIWKSWEAWFASTTLCKSIKNQKSFWSQVFHAVFHAVFLSFSLLPLSLALWLIQQDAGNYSHLRGQQERRDTMQSVRTWQERRQNAVGDLRILKAQQTFFFFFLLPCLIAIFRSFPCHSPSSSRELRDVAEMQHQHASPSQRERQ